MKPEVAQLWVNALRSGDYREGNTPPARQSLKRHIWLGDGTEYYDPLGVLCDVYMWETGDGSWARPTGQVHYKFATWEDESTYALPKDVQEWAGTNHGTVFLMGEPLHLHFNPKNQEDRLSFNDIAQLIEEEYIDYGS